MSLFISDALIQREFDLTRVQWVLLKLLHDRDGQTQNELALITDRNKASLTRLIHTMERKELVRRTSHTKDKRYNQIFLTNKGRQLYQATLPTFYECLNQLQAGMDEQEIEQLIHLLKKIQNNITRLPAEATKKKLVC